MPKLQSVSMASVFLHEFLPDDESVNHFPALRQLTTTDIILPPIFSNPWKRFLNQSCAKVTSVRIDYPANGGPWFQVDMDLLAECCLSLNYLVFYLPCWKSIRPHLTLPPSVSHLGLHSASADPNPYSTDFEHLFTALSTITGSKLKTVRLLHTVEDLRKNHGSFRMILASKLAEITSCITFRIEDHEGHPLVLDT